MNGVKKIKLDNGIRLITVNQKGSLSATLFIFVGTGSEHETKEINGISHFLEHMMFKGTKKRPSPLDISEPLDSIGASFNALTSNQYTGYYAKVPYQEIETAFEVLSDVYINSTFPEEEIEKERNVILEEINMYRDTPMYHVEDLLTDVLYGDQPAGWNITGTAASVRSINRNHLVDYFKSHYKSENTVLVATGNIDGKKVASLANKYFKGVRKGAGIEKNQVLINKNSSKVLLETRKTDQVHLCIGCHGFTLLDKEKYSQDIIAAVLGGMMSSRLFTEIREKMGACYYINCGSEVYLDHGYLYVQTGVELSKVEKVIKKIVEQFGLIASKRVPGKEINKAKGYLSGKLSLSLEQSDVLANFYGTQEILKGKFIKPIEALDELNKVSSDDIIKTAKKIFFTNNLHLAVIGPFDEKDDKKFLKLLNI